jgi:inosose dehydratase
MTVHIANSPDSWGVWFPSNPAQIPWQRYLDEVVEAGYTGTELGPYGYLPTRPTDLRRELDTRALQLTAGFLMQPLEQRELYSSIERSALDTGDLLASCGASFLVLIDGEYRDLATGQTTADAALSEEQWKRLVETSNRLGDLVKTRFGLQLAFHPHADTHVEYETQAERLIAEADPALVSVCLDLGHLEYRGGDAVSFFRKHHARITYLHLKSVSASIRARVDAESLPLNEAVKLGVFCEPDLGTLDYVAFARALEEAQFAGWATVEQDRDPRTFEDALGSARRTLRYFREIGMVEADEPVSPTRSQG